MERACQARTGLDLTVPKDCMAREELCVPGIVRWCVDTNRDRSEASLASFGWAQSVANRR